MSTIYRAATYAFIFDGQSLNQFPLQPNNYPTVMMGDFAIPSPWIVVAEGGASWSELLDGVYRPVDGVSVAPAATRTFTKASLGLTTFLLMCGGTQDVLEDDNAATILSDMETYATDAKSAGFDFVVAQTITPSGQFSAGQDDERLAANVLILASAAFDAVADVATAMPNPADTDNYSDETHWTDLGAETAAGLTLAEVEGLL